MCSGTVVCRWVVSQGIEIDRSVLAFWVGYAAAELMPLWQRMREILLGSPRLFVDETRAPVLDPGRGRTKTGYFRSIARDDSAWRGDTGPPAVVYTYAPGRASDDRRDRRCQEGGGDDRGERPGDKPMRRTAPSLY
jgi:hypothetical protein